MRQGPVLVGKLEIALQHNFTKRVKNIFVTESLFLGEKGIILVRAFEDVYIIFN